MPQTSSPHPDERLRNLMRRYAIVFNASEYSIRNFERNQPTLNVLQYFESIEHITFPLAVERAIKDVLPAFWYCLHLPRWWKDLLVSTADEIKYFHNEFTLFPHKILFVPVPCPPSLLPKYNSPIPTQVFVRDNLRSKASEVIDAFGRTVCVTSIDSLSLDTMQQEWRQIISDVNPQRETVLPPQHFVNACPASVSWLPSLSLMHSLGLQANAGELVADWASRDAGVDFSINLQQRLSAVSRLKLDGRSALWGEIPKEELNKERTLFRCPIAIGLPGISPYSSPRRIADIAKELQFEKEDDAEIENSTLGFVVTHRALSRQGIGILADKVPDEAFVTLRSLELDWAQGTPKPAYIWKLLKQLGLQITKALSPSQIGAIRHANNLECFSEFPIGLAILEGDSSPIGCQFPISYRPICPLSRALSRELDGTAVTFLKNRLKILIVECIPVYDRIGKISRDVWTRISNILAPYSGVSVTFVEAKDVADIKKSIESDKYDILVISAHGGVVPDRNAAGFQCGGRMIVDDDLGEIPPLVCLSACQVSPRGYGTVNIGDLFFKRGATAILGPLVPIDVRHNASLMTNFLKNIATEVCSPNTGVKSYQQVWHHTAISNAVYDVLSVNAKASLWASETSNGLSVLDEFKLEADSNPPRLPHLYNDTVSRLRLIAERRGIGQKFDSWLIDGFVPETSFYALLGWPDRAVFQNNPH